MNVVIGVGANCGDRKVAVENALCWLHSQLRESEASAIYETPCARKTGKEYMNAVIAGVYPGLLEQLQDSLKEYEEKMGRTSECRERGEVPMDLDIVICDNSVVKEWDFRQRFFIIGYEEIRDHYISLMSPPVISGIE